MKKIVKAVSPQGFLVYTATQHPKIKQTAVRKVLTFQNYVLHKIYTKQYIMLESNFNIMTNTIPYLFFHHRL